MPDGGYPGMEFTVEYEGRSFNVAVPEGCEPGMPLSVEVPAGDSGGGSSQTQEEQDAELARQLQAEEDELSQNLQEQRDAELAKSLQGDEVRESAYCGGGSSSTWSSTAGDAPASGWAPASQSQSLFSMAVGTDDGTFGKPAGDFHVGQLVQVTRSDGTWTYGKIMQHDSGGDTYSVMTRLSQAFRGARLLNRRCGGQSERWFVCPTVNSRPAVAAAESERRATRFATPMCVQNTTAPARHRHHAHFAPDWTIQVRIIQVLVRACFDFGRAKRRNAERKEF